MGRKAHLPDLLHPLLRSAHRPDDLPQLRRDLHAREPDRGQGQGAAAREGQARAGRTSRTCPRSTPTRTGSRPTTISTTRSSRTRRTTSISRRSPTSRPTRRRAERSPPPRPLLPLIWPGRPPKDGRAVSAALRGHSSAGRALAWHARGQGFDPPWLHQPLSATTCSSSQTCGRGLPEVGTRPPLDLGSARDTARLGVSDGPVLPDRGARPSPTTGVTAAA